MIVHTCSIFDCHALVLNRICRNRYDHEMQHVNPNRSAIGQKLYEEPTKTVDIKSGGDDEFHHSNRFKTWSYDNHLKPVEQFSMRAAATRKIVPNDVQLIKKGHDRFKFGPLSHRELIFMHETVETLKMKWGQEEIEVVEMLTRKHAKSKEKRMQSEEALEVLSKAMNRPKTNIKNAFIRHFIGSQRGKWNADDVDELRFMLINLLKNEKDFSVRPKLPLSDWSLHFNRNLLSVDNKCKGLLDSIRNGELKSALRRTRKTFTSDEDMRLLRLIQRIVLGLSLDTSDSVHGLQPVLPIGGSLPWKTIGLAYNLEEKKTWRSQDSLRRRWYAVLLPAILANGIHPKSGIDRNVAVRISVRSIHKRLHKQMTKRITEDDKAYIHDFSEVAPIISSAFKGFEYPGRMELLRTAIMTYGDPKITGKLNWYINNAGGNAGKAAGKYKRAVADAKLMGSDFRLMFSDLFRMLKVKKHYKNDIIRLTYAKSILYDSLIKYLQTLNGQ
eukprot:GHVH01002212.1.p1 GENE.GHVH01002212.1~~GHVH01002212.1.p1  ORF type:complete len:499 (-),score=55.66 GHVH01002212.1:127-1623(-)